MKRQNFSGLEAPLADVLPSEFNADLIEAFFASGETPGREKALKHANMRAEPLDLGDFALQQQTDETEEPPVAAEDGATDTPEDISERPDADLPEMAREALRGLERAMEHAHSDLDTLARPLKTFARHEEHADQQDHDHDHGDQIIEDAMAKPVWAGGDKETEKTTKGKGNGKNKDTSSTDETDTTTDTTGTETDATDTTTDTSGTETDGTDTTTDTTGTETGGTDTTTDTSGTETDTTTAEPNVFVSGLDTPDGFNIELVFDGDWTETQKGFLASAAEKISDVITGDVPDYNGIDDIQITVTQASIDGDGGAWATGGPRSLRSDSYLPSTGVLTFDTADVDALDSKGLWEDLGMHEMLHAMGFGTLFSYKGLVDTIDGQQRFTGDNAIDAYNNSFSDIAANDPLSDLGVQLDGSGAHWHDGTFTKELMTPYLRYSGNYLSDMSIAAMEDIGYDTIYEPVTVA